MAKDLKLSKEDAKMRRFFRMKVVQAQAALQALSDTESEWLTAMREKYAVAADAQLAEDTDEFVDEVIK